MSTFTSEPAPQGMQQRSIFLICCCVPWLLGMSLSGVAVSLPLIQNDLGADRADGQWIVGGYTVVLGSLILMSGALADRFGSRKVFTGGLAIFALSSLGCMLAPTASSLVVARLVQGVCSITLVPVAILVISEIFSDRTRQAKALTLWATMASVSSALNPLLVGWLVSETGWRLLFASIGVLGAVGSVLGWRLLPPTPGHPEQRIAIGKQALLAATLVAALAMLIGGRGGLEVTYIAAAGSSFVVLLTLFLVLERIGQRRVISAELWHVPGFRRSLAVQFGLFLAFNGFFFGNALYQQHVRGLNPAETMVWFLPGSMAVLVFSLLARYIVGRGHEQLLVAFGLGAIGAGLLLLGYTSTLTPGLWVFLVSYALIGAGLGSASGAIYALNLTGMPAHLGGSASALVTAATIVGNAVGATLAASITAAWSQIWLHTHTSGQPRAEVLRAASGGAGLTDGTPFEKQLVFEAFGHGLQVAYVVLVVLALVTGGLALTLPALSHRLTNRN